MVLNPVALPNASKVKKLGDLASELGSDAMSIRDNEGEAANYGVYFDDTEYDYMQHIRDIGEGGGEAVFVPAEPLMNKNKGKQKESLEDALRQLDLENNTKDLIEDETMLPSKHLPKQNYQAQQDVPDAIAGFQPDMDPRLREVLEALEDDAYVDDDEDIFQELAKERGEIDEYEFDETWDDTYPDEDDQGWESDATAKPNKEYNETDEVPDLVAAPEAQAENGQGPSDDWYDEYKKFKQDKSAEKKPAARGGLGGDGRSEMLSSIWTTTTNGGKRKKRKGALTEASNYSMTSSSLVRTEQLGILDERFEKIEEQYNTEFDDMASVSAISSMSSVTGPTRNDFDGLLDDFLGTHKTFNKKYVRKGWNTGTQQLDEIRRELGKPIIPKKYLSKK